MKLFILDAATAALQRSLEELTILTRNRWKAGLGVIASALLIPCASIDLIAAESEPRPTKISQQELITLKETTLKISAAFKGSTNAYDRMAELCDRFGARPAGSTNLELAIDWILDKARGDGLEVMTEAVSLLAWQRGEESAELTSPRAQKLHLMGLGGTIPTPPEGITADVVVVPSLAALTNAGSVKGKIVLINQPFTTYGETVVVRGRGAIEAAKLGAVACLIRSVAPYSMQTPHTGRMRYDPNVPRIPAAALSLEDAEILARMQARGDKLRIKLKMNSREFPAQSRNVIAEFAGVKSQLK